jgi:hypothetical protein
VNDLTTGSIPCHIVRLAVPMALGMIFQTLYYLVDLYFVARLGDAAVAGVSAGGNVQFIILSFTQILGVSTMALIANAVGQKDQNERDEPHGSATRRTREGVDLEDLLEEGYPSASGLARRQAWRGNDRGRPVRGGGRRLAPRAPRTVRIPAVVPCGDLPLVRNVHEQPARNSSGSAVSAYVAFDMSGNVSEWNDPNGTAGAQRGVRGCCWAHGASPLSSVDGYTDCAIDREQLPRLSARLGGAGAALGRSVAPR